MAVQKSRKTPSRRNMRRSHDALKGSTLSIDAVTGELHRRRLLPPTAITAAKNWSTARAKTDSRLFAERLAYCQCTARHGYRASTSPGK